MNDEARRQPGTPAPIRYGMVLAAGLGKRMRPLTEKTPKVLLEVDGRTLLDRAIDRLEEAGVTTVVVNTHHHADAVEKHLAARKHPEILISHEDELLETGGGVKKALPVLGNEPFYVANGDSLWLNGPHCTLDLMRGVWNADEMDALLLVHESVTAHGYSGPGDFVMEPDGRLGRRPEQEVSPYFFAGVQILHPRVFEGTPDGPFSLNVIYDRALAEGRLYGTLHDGEWFHVGTPEGLEEAEAFMQVRYAETRHRW